MNTVIFGCLVYAGGSLGAYLAGSAHATVGFWLGALVSAAGLIVQIRRDRAEMAEYIKALRRGDRPKEASTTPRWVPKALLAVAVVNVVVFVGVWIAPAFFLEFLSASGLRSGARWYALPFACAVGAIKYMNMPPLVGAHSHRSIWMVRGLVGLGVLVGVTRVFLLMSGGRGDLAQLATVGYVLFVTWCVVAAILLVGAPALLSEDVARFIQAPFSTRS
jgi:hypothetical protein